MKTRQRSIVSERRIIWHRDKSGARRPWLPSIRHEQELQLSRTALRDERAIVEDGRIILAWRTFSSGWRTDDRCRLGYVRTAHPAMLAGLNHFLEHFPTL